ncbi:Uncharacterized protein dnm_007820 [Desulfonema magnum]|uniref:Uncharacterized protein n=1 Tax=Desulfonema magnum TaxID=45655 RepID=A0A975BG42_9BACT|nr:Uncharacterized protein dnm_007820 [Desulfonema magnum]
MFDLFFGYEAQTLGFASLHPPYIFYIFSRSADGGFRFASPSLHFLKKRRRWVSLRCTHPTFSTFSQEAQTVGFASLHPPYIFYIFSRSADGGFRFAAPTLHFLKKFQFVVSL